MRLLPPKLRFRAASRNKIQLIKVDQALWVWSCPHCHVWGEGAVWEVVYDHMLRHVDFIHYAILRELDT